MSHTIHALVGYDRNTDLIAVEHRLPDDRFEEVKRIAGVGEDDPEGAYSYALDWQQAKAMGPIANAGALDDSYEYFLESFAQPAKRMA